MTAASPLALASPAAPAGPARPGHRRRLWELPPASHEWLLGLSFDAQSLHRLAERALSRLRGQRCVMQGSEADILFSVVHSVGHRNRLAEALHEALQERHAVALRAWRGLLDENRCRAAWQQALATGGADAAGALWALLTHPHGPALESQALYELRTAVLARQRLAQARDERVAALEPALAEARSKVAELHLRLAASQQLNELQRLRQDSETIGLRGELQRQVAAAATPAASEAPPPQRPARATPSAAKAHVAAPAGPPVVPVVPVTPAAPAATDLQGQRLLCVGGMPGARQRYRALVEAAGARFEYHDGGLEDNVARLDGLLAGADLVVCQAGCLNHEAYRRIKGHCQRQGTRCVYLERPSLSHFARSLGLGRHASAT